MPIQKIFDNPVVRVALAGIGTAVAVATGLYVTDDSGPSSATSGDVGAVAEARQDLSDLRRTAESRREILDVWGDDHCRFDIDVVDIHSGDSVPAKVLVDSTDSSHGGDGEPDGTLAMPMKIDGPMSFPVGCAGWANVSLLELPDDYEPYSVLSGLSVLFDQRAQVESHQIAVVKRGVERWHEAWVTAVVWDISTGEKLPYEGADVRFVETAAFGRHDPATGTFERQFVTSTKETDEHGVTMFQMVRHIGELVLEQSDDYEIVGVDREKFDWRPLPNSTGEVADKFEQVDFVVRRVDDEGLGGEGDDGDGAHIEDENAEYDTGGDGVTTSNSSETIDSVPDDDADSIIDETEDETDSIVDEAEDAAAEAIDDGTTGATDDANAVTSCDGEDASVEHSAGEIGRALGETWGVPELSSDKRRALGQEVQRAVEWGDLCERDVDVLVEERRATEAFVEWSFGLDLGAVFASVDTESALPDRAVSSFDDGALGWTIWGDAQGESVEPTFVADVGVPAGSLGATDDETGGIWFWRAPSSFWADEVDPTPGPVLRYDLRQNGSGPLFAACDVIVVDGDLGACLMGMHVPAETFMPYVVRFRAGDEDWREIDVSDGFPVDTEHPGEPLGQRELDAIVGSVDELLIRGEFITGPDEGGLDNVSLGSV